MGAVCHRKLLAMAVLLAVHFVAAKPGQLQEERREYQYQRSHRVSSSNTMDGGGAGYYNSRSGNYQAQDSGMSDWAKSHQEQVQRMAEQMRSEYTAATTGAASMSSGGRSFSSSVAMANGNAEDCDKPTAFAYSFTGKSQAELDEMAKKMTHQIIEELQTGQLRQSQITQPKWFLHRAAEKMEEREGGQQHNTQQQTSYGSETEDLQQQQQQIFSQDEIRQSQGAGYGGYNYNRENYERTQERQPPPVVSGGHYSSSQSKKEEEERYRTYRPAPTPAYTTSHSQSSSNQQSSERRSQVVIPTPVSVVSEYNKQDSEYSRSQVQTPTTIPTHSGSYFSQSLHDRHRQYQRPRPLESASSTHYQSNVEEEEESQQRQMPIVVPSQHTYSASSSQINKETETVPVNPQTYNYGREHSAREESSYSRNRSYPVPTVSSSRHRQQHQSEVIVETITHKPIVNAGSTHRIYDYKTETDLKVSPLYKPAYTEQSHHEKFEEEQMRIRQQQQRQPVVTVTSQKEQVESEVNRQRYRQPQPVIHTSMSAHEAEDTQQVQQVVFEQPTVESSHRDELTEEEERRRIYNQRQPGYVHSSSQTDEMEESRRTTQQRPSYGGSSSQHTVQETERSDSRYARPTYGGSTSQSGYNRTEESSSREHRPAPVAVSHYSASQKETKEESEYRRQQQQQPTQTIYTTTIEERNEEIRRRQQQQADYERRYAASGYNRSESESSYSGGQYQGGVSGGHREYSLEERERQRTAGGGGSYYVQSGYSKEEEERRRLEYERRQQEAAAGSASTHETENVQASGFTAHQDQTSYTSSMGENDVQQKLIDVDTVVEEVTETGDKTAKTIISKDRGDQPPQTFEEDYESEEILEAEPGIGVYPIDKKPEPLLSSTTPNPYYSAPLAPYTSEQEKRRYQATMSQHTQVVPTAAETEEYQRHYQRTHSSHQYTSGNLYPQQHAQQHELGNVLTEQTSDLNVSPMPPLDAASQTLHRQTSSSVVVGSSGSDSVSTNYNTQQQDLAGAEQIRESAEAFGDDEQQRQVAIDFDGTATGSHNEQLAGSFQGNGKYVETADQLEERRRKANEKNSTWNHESSYTFEVQKEIDGDDYADVQQQVQDMAKEFGEDMGQQREHEDLTQRQMDHYSRGESQRLQQHQQSSYSHGGAHQSSYGNLEAQEKDNVEEPAPEVTPEPVKETAGFWRRFRNKAKDIVG